jgi:accessory colonization factor AcfC
MSLFKLMLYGVFLLQVATATASTGTQDKVLRVYGPGGPHQVLLECADLYFERTGVNVAVIRALPYDLERNLPKDGDIYYGGAEYMLEDFDRKNPGVLVVSTAEKLHARRIGIIVRKGNPLSINGVDALSGEAVDLLDVKLEKMRNFYGNPANKLGNVSHLVYTGRQGLSAWLSYPDLDAWVTYKSWHALISEDADFIEIPSDNALRYTPVALTTRTMYRQEAMAFINFLKSKEARIVFAKHGWE